MQDNYSIFSIVSSICCAGMSNGAILFKIDTKLFPAIVLLLIFDNMGIIRYKIIPSEAVHG